MKTAYACMDLGGLRRVSVLGKSFLLVSTRQPRSFLQDRAGSRSVWALPFQEARSSDIKQPISREYDKPNHWTVVYSHTTPLTSC